MVIRARIDDKHSLSLYLHIPFCQHRCSYCDFNTYTSLSELKDVYVDALCHEIAQVSGSKCRSAHTVFFGGGTPSLISPQSLENVLQCLQENFDLNQEAEITLELNPETVDEAYLVAVLKAGFNRLSIGVQSVVPSELALLEREHDFEKVVRVVAWARSAGFQNVNLDLIYGLPKQDLKSWQRSLESALALNPEHLSLYCLTIEEGTPMHRWLKNGQIKSPLADIAADQYEYACELLSNHQFIHYEISNWSIPGKECRHNLTYWRNQEYLGMGAGAHGHAAGYRYAVVKQPRVYIRRINDAREQQYPWSSAVSQKHRLTKREAMSDTIITQLRLLEEGLDLTAFNRSFGVTLFKAYPGVCEQLMSWRLIEVDGEQLLLTSRGSFLSNQVFYRFL
jgi:oxygen-independent coproporphyrinogen-3 oxidase